MQHKKKQSSIVLLKKIASGFTLVSVFSISSLVGLSRAFATTETLILRESGLPVGEGNGTLMAQTIDTLLSYDTADYAVRVFREGDQVKMNVFDRSVAGGLLRVNGNPATFTVRGGRSAYITTGDYSGRQAQYIAEVFPNEFARLVIIDGSEQIIASQDATQITTFNVPQGDLEQVRQNTVLRFETASYAVRVLERDGQKFMNVYNKFTTQSEVNGGPANLVPAEPPYENAVSYVASGERNNQPVRYIARIDNNARTLLEIYNINNQRLFQEPGTGEVLVNIPDSDLPPQVDEIGQDIDDAFVAAVFGGQDTLQEVQQLFPDAFMDSSRQGDFINAGAFANQDAAQLRVLELRSQGFNARLVYRDVRYR